MFRNQYDTEVSFNISDPRPANLYYFSFRSTLWNIEFDSRGPDILFSLDFVLRSPQTIVAVSSLALSNLASPSINIIGITAGKGDLEAFQFKLDNLADNHVGNLINDEIRELLKRSVSAIFSTSFDTVKRAKEIEKNLFGILTSISHILLHSTGTQKMDCVFASASKRSIAMYTGPLFLGGQQ